MASPVAAFFIVGLTSWFLLRPAALDTIDGPRTLSLGVLLVAAAALAVAFGQLARSLGLVRSRKQPATDGRAMTRLHEELKRTSNERRIFEALIDNSSDFIGIADPTGRPTYLNPAGRQLIRLPPDVDIERTQIPDYYSPGERLFATEVILKRTVEEGQWQGETYFRNWQTGEAIPVSDKHFMIRDPQTGETLGMATITRDISGVRTVHDALTRANRELTEAREFLADVLRNSTEYSIIAKDLDRRIVAWNKGAERNYGYTAAEMVGRSSDVLHVADELKSGLVVALHQRALEQGQAAGLFRRRRKDGSEFLAQVMITRRNDATGNPVGYLVISHDVVAADQRHMAQQRFLAQVGEALHSSLDYAATVEHIAELAVSFMCDACAVDVVRKDGSLERMRVVHADPAKAALASALEEIVPGRNHPVWRALEARQPLLFAEVTPDFLPFLARDEEHLRLLEELGPRSAMLVPLVARGRIMAVLSMVSCRPQRTYGTEDLRLAEELGRRASLALDNARLYEVAREAIQSREQIMDVVAHDLRNPLGAILLQTAGLKHRDGVLTDEARKPFEVIQRAATRMNRLIQDLLDLRRIEAGHLAITPRRVRTTQLVSEAIEVQQVLTRAATLELRHELPEQLPDICADRDRIQQVFENLISNAVKFTAPGGRITVVAEGRAQEVLFSVRDTGSGIAADDLPHVFERYWQANKQESHGAGLGLAIVKGIVEAHGGQIWAESAPGRGTVFFFTVPTADYLEAHRSKLPQPREAREGVR